jgi:hypothetical protein
LAAGFVHVGPLSVVGKRYLAEQNAPTKIILVGGSIPKKAIPLIMEIAFSMKRCAHGNGAPRKTATTNGMSISHRPASQKRGFLPNSCPGEPASHHHEADGARIQGNRSRRSV